MRYVSPRREVKAVLPTVVDMLRLRGGGHALNVLKQAEIELEETGGSQVRQFRLLGRGSNTPDRPPWT